MKQTATCPKCSSQQIWRIDQVVDTAEWFGNPKGDLDKREHGPAVARRVLRLRTTKVGVFGGKSERIELTGEVEAYCCSDCGYLEEYLRNPASIDFSQVVGAGLHVK